MNDDVIVTETPGTDTFDTLGGRIYRAREESGLTQVDLAHRMGIKSSTLQAWESDKSEPRSNKLVMLSGILNVSPSWLIMGEGESPGVSEYEGGKANAQIRQELMDIRKQIAELSDKLQSVIDKI